MTEGQDTDSLLGTILVRTGAAPADAVEHALEQQRGGDGRNLGQLLRADGLTKPALQQAVDIQATWRDGDVEGAARALVATATENVRELAEAVKVLAAA